MNTELSAWIQEDCIFAREFKTYIIAFCPDYDYWFVTNQRFFYYEYPKEFQTENEAIDYFVNNPSIFYEKEIEMKVYRPHFNENGVFLENIKKLIEVQCDTRKPRKNIKKKKLRTENHSNSIDSNKEYKSEIVINSTDTDIDYGLENFDNIGF